jgi:hypothetical protein
VRGETAVQARKDDALAYNLLCYIKNFVVLITPCGGGHSMSNGSDGPNEQRLFGDVTTLLALVAVGIYA